MRRAEILLVLGLAGCMKIYPDPELPDVKVGWGDQDCRADAPNIAITLTGLDDEASTNVTTVPCADHEVTVADLPRERFHVEGALLDLSGKPFITSDGGDVDLRNGYDTDTGLYFDIFANFRVTWTFSSGTCESLGANSMGVFFSLPGEPDVNVNFAPCLFPQYTGNAPPGTYTVQLRAFTFDQDVIAVSPESAPFEITETGFTDLGAFTLTPCGASCP